jgi:hypothetical protein
MKLKTLFIANTIVSVPFGIGSALTPHLFLSLFGAELDPAGALMMQFGGAWLIGIGLLTWFTRGGAESETGQGVTYALLIAYAVALVVSARGQIAGVLNVLGWLPFLIQVFFTSAFGYSLIAKRRDVASLVQRT